MGSSARKGNSTVISVVIQIFVALGSALDDNIITRIFSSINLARLVH